MFKGDICVILNLLQRKIVKMSKAIEKKILQHCMRLISLFEHKKQ